MFKNWLSLKKSTYYRYRSPLLYIALSVAIALLCILTSPSSASVSPQLHSSAPLSVELSSPPSIQTLYENQQFEDAITQLRSQIQTYQADGDSFREAVAWRNLALVYGELGNWSEVETAILNSLNLLRASSAPNQVEAIAHTLELKGRLQLAQGRAEEALITWKETETLYAQLDNQPGINRSLLNQAEALQTLGFYRQAIATLEPLTESLREQTPSIYTVQAFRSLGEALQATGSLERSESLLNQALAIAEQLADPEEIALAHLSLGNLLTTYDPPTSEIVQDHYQHAINLSSSALVQLQAKSGLFQRLSDDGLWEPARALAQDLSLQFNNLPISRAAIYTRIHFVQTWLELEAAIAGNTPIPTSILRPLAEHLQIAQQLAQSIHDHRAESYALGSLGGIYERTQQWQISNDLTEDALNLSQQLNSNEMSYLWQWQLGRVLNAQNKREEAIAAYSEAIKTLQQLQTDLVITPDIQLSFRNSIEPIHRQFVQLLLQSSSNQEPTEDSLKRARTVIESLQLAELNDFFRDACLTTQSTGLEQLDPQAAIIYPIILPDRLEIILSLPGQTSLKHYSVEASKNKLITEVGNLAVLLKSPPSGSDVDSDEERLTNYEKDIYNWLIRPMEEDLSTTDVRTLIFVLDQQLRNIPMSVLFDGEQFLVEKYNLAFAPGLELLTSPSQRNQSPRVLLAGLSESQSGFPALPNVITELEQIRSTIPDRSEVLLNQAFTAAALERAITSEAFSIIHLATHGQFLSSFEGSFILTGDGQKLDLNQFRNLLQTAILNRDPIDLLVLSACETAVEGNNPRATLGLAGVAVRSGAASTMATLWQVNDKATSLLMTQFYKGLAAQLSKAEALRQAQLLLLSDPNYHHPFFWSAVILIGDWH